MGPRLGARSVLAMGAGGLLSWGAPPAGAQTPVPVGAEFQVNTYTTNGQGYPSVAADADGDFVVVWTSYGSSGSDASATSVQGQRYAVPPNVPSLSPAGFAAGALLLLLAVGTALRRRS